MGCEFGVGKIIKFTVCMSCYLRDLTTCNQAQTEDRKVMLPKILSLSFDLSFLTQSFLA